MQKRFVSIWFPHLCTDWLLIRKPALKGKPFVFVSPDHGRLMITAANMEAMQQGIACGMRLADAKALVSGLEVMDDKAGRQERLLKGIGEWCIRFSPLVAVDAKDGLLLDASGCTHLWGGEREYLKNLVSSLKAKGYQARVAMADTIGTAWAVSRYGKITPLIAPGQQVEALAPLPPAALRLEAPITERLKKLGFLHIRQFLQLKRSVLRRRFGEQLLLRLAQALGQEAESFIPLQAPPQYEARLPCLEPIRTATGIEMAIQKLLEALCLQLKNEGMGIRSALLKCYRIDGKLEQVEVGTSRPSHSISHLLKLFELKISGITPALGIELFTLQALKVEEALKAQEALWAGKPGLEGSAVAELLDRLAGKMGASCIHRYLPQEQYWPERALKRVSLQEKKQETWRSALPRPIQLLHRPEAIEVSAPIPDYPPMLFRYQGKVHHIKKADGPERIEREWWLEQGEHRDYYYVEDETGCRYWLFRSGHYEGLRRQQWFIHGFFA